MRITRLSPSAYNQHEGCPHAYFISNVLKYRYPAGMAAQRGTAAHRILELIALQKLAKQNGEEFFILKDKEISADASIADLFVHMETDEGLTNNFSESDLQEYKRFVYNALSLQDGYYDPRKRNIVAPEARINLPIEQDWAKLDSGDYFVLSGIIDLVTDVGNNTYEIVDWKTGSRKDFNTGKIKEYADFVKDPQLRFYHLAATQLYGEDKNYIVSIVFVKSMESFSIAFEPEDVPDTLELIKSKYIDISTSLHPERIQSWKCKKFCDFGKRDHSALGIPAREQYLTGGIARIGEPMTMCDIVHEEIETNGIDYAEKTLKKT